MWARSLAAAEGSQSSSPSRIDARFYGQPRDPACGARNPTSRRRGGGGLLAPARLSRGRAASEPPRASRLAAARPDPGPPALERGAGGAAGGPRRRRGGRLRGDAPAGPRGRPRGGGAAAALGRPACVRPGAGRPPRRAHGRPSAGLVEGLLREPNGFERLLVGVVHTPLDDESLPQLERVAELLCDVQPLSVHPAPLLYDHEHLVSGVEEFERLDFIVLPLAVPVDHVLHDSVPTVVEGSDAGLFGARIYADSEVHCSKPSCRVALRHRRGEGPERLYVRLGHSPRVWPRPCAAATYTSPKRGSRGCASQASAGPSTSTPRTASEAQHAGPPDGSRRPPPAPRRGAERLSPPCTPREAPPSAAPAPPGPRSPGAGCRRRR